MNNAQLIDALTDRLGNKKAAGEAVEAFVDTVTRAVTKGERVSITGFGVFEKIERKARTGRNPATGAAVKVKKKSVPRFKPGQGFKDIVSGAKKLPKAAVAKATGTTASGKATASKTTGRAGSGAGATSKRTTGGSTGVGAAAKRAASKSTARPGAGSGSPAKKATGTRKSTARSAAKKS